MGNTTIKQCRRCKDDFEVEKGVRGLFVCDECKADQKRKGYEKTCVICKNKYTTQEPQAGRPVCDDCKLEKREQKKKEQLEEYLVCPLCLQQTGNEITSRVKYISYKHLQGHGYTSEQFKKEFPNQPMKIKSIGEKHSKALSGENHFNYGKQLSRVARKNISRAVSETWADHNETKNCTRCGKRMIARNENDICSECMEKHFAFEDTDDLVYCRICNVVKKNLTKHIKHKHGLNREEYKKKYNASVSSKTYREKIAKWHFKKISDSHSNALKKLHSKIKSQKQQWEENFKTEDYQHLVDRKLPIHLIDTEDFIFCRICLDTRKRVSPQHLVAHQLTTKMYQKLFPEAPIVCKRISKYIGQKSYETKLDSGQMSIGQSYGYGGTRKDVGHYVRSMLEANFARILKLNNIIYDYESETFQLSNSKFASITPDFRLQQDFFKWKKGDFIETKGFCDEDTLDKIEDFENQYPQYVHYLLIQDSDVWKELEELYKSRIPLWEDSIRNIKTDPDVYNIRLEETREGS